MRSSEFNVLAEEVFGSVQARTLTRDLVLTALGDRTAEVALADGVAPGDVWVALCDAMEVPQSQRWGRRTRGRRPGTSA